MKISVKQDLCCAAQLCTKNAPGIFRLDCLGYNASDGDEVPPGKEAEARRGARSCPEGAINLEGD